MEPEKDKAQEPKLAIPSVSQFKGQFASDIGAWTPVIKEFSDNVQLEIMGLLYRMEDSEDISTGMFRQLATIFRGNSKEEKGLRIAEWLEYMADSGDFFRESVDAVVETASNGMDEEEDENSEEAV
jgi:hypothetical protein